MKKTWDVNVNGTVHTLEYKTGFGGPKITVNGQTYQMCIRDRYRVQTAELQHDKREKEPSGPDGNQQILQILQEAHTAQGNEVRCRKG